MNSDRECGIHFGVQHPSALPTTPAEVIDNSTDPALNTTVQVSMCTGKEFAVNPLAPWRQAEGRGVPTRSLSVTLVLALVLGLTLAGSSTAIASTPSHHDWQHGKSDHSHNKGKFEPIPREESTTLVSACGSTVTITNGDVFTLRERITNLKHGFVLTEIKGGYTNDLVTTDGRKRNEVDNSGPYEVLTAPDGTSTFTVHPPALIYPFVPGEVEVFAAAGLPQIFYFTSGTLIFKTNADDEITEFVKVPKKVGDACNLLKRSKNH